MEKEIVKEYLKCMLTQAQLKEQAEKMADNLSQIAQYEADLKSIKRQIEADIAKCQSELTSAHERYRSRFEMKNVDCEVRKNFETNTVTVIRTDTGEVVRERALTAEERQLMLELEKKETEPPAQESLPDLDAGDEFYSGKRSERFEE
jgi:hypothetical protein